MWLNVYIYILSEGVEQRGWSHYLEVISLLLTILLWMIQSSTWSILCCFHFPVYNKQTKVTWPFSDFIEICQSFKKQCICCTKDIQSNWELGLLSSWTPVLLYSQTVKLVFSHMGFPTFPKCATYLLSLHL